jgi:hypothetical protein
MRIVVDRSCFLETSTHLQETNWPENSCVACCLEWIDTRYWERLSIPNSPPHDSNYTNLYRSNSMGTLAQVHN